MGDFGPHSLRTVNVDFLAPNVIEMHEVILETGQEN
jgi:hypothetical protein